ncbi:hypothetical protein EDF70_11378 [Neorhizobium sp. JUb45]|nr:hypothetical protein EDF70_11378 [Neorhizobium sp. JUb45]
MLAYAEEVPGRACYRINSELPTIFASKYSFIVDFKETQCRSRRPDRAFRCDRKQLAF